MDTHADPSLAALTALRNEVRRICHDLSNPLGILRMAVYFLQTSKADAEKREQYYAMMNESIDRIERHLKELQVLMAADTHAGDAGSPTA